jgi:hypothetical protein
MQSAEWGMRNEKTNDKGTNQQKMKQGKKQFLERNWKS